LVGGGNGHVLHAPKNSFSETASLFPILKKMF
jgi:hypothetical protein